MCIDILRLRNRQLEFYFSFNEYVGTNTPLLGAEHDHSYR